MPVQRYKLTIAYRGTHYHGWQRQSAPDSDLPDADPANSDPAFSPAPHLPLSPAASPLPTIQESVARALASVVGHPLNLVGSSRTDSGVHAKGQVAHFDTDQTQIPPDNLRRAANHRLPDDILIRSLDPVPADFDAIRWTVRKRYQYLIWNQPNRNPFAPDLSWHRWQELDLPAIAAAAKFLEGEHDFTSFARAGHGRSSAVRTIHSCRLSGRGPMLVIGLESNGFLWHMCRIIVGTLLEIGLSRRPPSDIPAMLAARDRQSAGLTAPPHGLYLQWIQFRPPPTAEPTG
jgi:tRNA pseudouridine38-40 synthase